MAPNSLPSSNMAPQQTTPLPAVFTPSAGCSNSFTFVNSGPSRLLLQNALPSFNSDCFPEGFNGHGTQANGPIYSPGVCPLGYTTTTTIGTAQGTTTAVCCQTDFEYFSTLSSDKHKQIVALEGCTSMYDGGLTNVADLKKKGLSTGTTSVSGPLTMWAQPITVQTSPPSTISNVESTTQGTSKTAAGSTINSSSPSSSVATSSTLSTVPSSTSDTPSSPPNHESPIPSNTILSSTNIATTSFTTTPTPSTPSPNITTSTSSPSSKANTKPTNKTHHNGLSSGAKAGISISILLATALLAIIAFILHRRRKQLKNSQKFIMQSPSHNSSNPQSPAPERLNWLTPSVLGTGGQTKQSQKSWKIPTRFPSWKGNAAGSGESGGRNEIQEATVSSISPISSLPSRGSHGGGLEVKGNRDVEPISPVSPVI